MRGLLRLRNKLLEMGFELIFDEEGQRFEHPADGRVISWALVERWWREIVQQNVGDWYGGLVSRNAVRPRGQGCADC